MKCHIVLRKKDQTHSSQFLSNTYLTHLLYLCDSFNNYQLTETKTYRFPMCLQQSNAPEIDPAIL